ncbi:hypothetical protein F4561_006556 [Lipingzhangella halophila]|uniref:Phage tail protein n=1 Tax=Lipingzhangella halophila TaxID=1783352 RepID=A0A7W7RPS0_9ACTN|nr:hypothetical protein [Lipingzhangella halophila]MBB4935647.1 hypothetical protein [Lipingzhangella halophila]
MSANLAAEEVRVGITGAFYSAPRGTAEAPEDASSSLDSAFTGHGYLNEDGAVESWDDSVDTIIGWQGATTVRSVRTESTATIELTLLQTRGSTLELFHPGSHVEENNGEWKMHVKPPTHDPRAFVLDVIDGDELLRIYIGNGELTERDEVPYANSGDPVQYPMTLTCYPDGNGDLMVKYSNSDAWGEGIAGES